MPQLYIYSNLTGTYVFNQKFYMIDKVVFNEKEAVKNSGMLELGRFIDSEKNLVKKHKKGSFSYIGLKTEEINGVKVVSDYEAYSKINDELKKDKKIFGKLKELNTVITRQKIRGAVNEDTLIVQTVSSIKELEKISNMLAKRLREWYGYYLPEFSESIKDHEKFAEIIAKKSKEQLLKELRLSKEDSMGADFKKEDLDQIIEMAKNLSGVYKLKKKQTDYLEKMMKSYCPNIQTIAGTLIAAKLLEKAGSLKKLVGFPSSTIQVLGAEEAFFRHMRTGAKMPKYGYLHEHPFISKADKMSKGKIARALADKIAIASKVDYFKGKFVGDKLRKMVEGKLK
ncbi:NOP5/NOP56 family protein [candidate division KSB1 bacterium]